MSFIRFLFSWKFFLQLLIALAITVGLVWGTLQWLSWYTGHDNYIPVPDLRGKLVSDIMSSQLYTDFRFIILDSVYDPALPPGTVLSQDPWFDARVKQNRQIYVTVSCSTPDMIAMPDLKFLTLRQAVSMLESYGLKAGKLIYTPAFDADAIQEQYFENHLIVPGTRIYKGSVIDLMVGTGGGSYQLLLDTATTADTTPVVDGYEVDDYIEF